jgi:hypothetical protein
MNGVAGTGFCERLDAAICSRLQRVCQRSDAERRLGEKGPKEELLRRRWEVPQGLNLKKLTCVHNSGNLTPRVRALCVPDSSDCRPEFG